MSAALQFPDVAQRVVDEGIALGVVRRVASGVEDAP